MKFNITRNALRLAVPVVVIIGFAGCVSDTGTSPETAETSVAASPVVTMVVPVTTTAGPQTTQAPDSGATQVPAMTAAPATTAEPVTETTDVLGMNPDGDKLMPDVVCENLQVAQDIIQTHGVFVSLSEDASGAGRNQLIDSNWIVVTQTPAPGTPFDEGEAVLSVVKLEEPNDC